MQGHTPDIPESVESRLGDIIKRSLVVSQNNRQDVSAMRHQLSNLGEILRLEAGGKTTIPLEVLNNADILPNSLESVLRSSTREGQVRHELSLNRLVPAFSYFIVTNVTLTQNTDLAL